MTNVEGPESVDTTEDTVVEDAAETVVGFRIFLALAAFFAVLAVVYGVTSGEAAGTALLALSGGLSIMTGGFLALVDRAGGLREELDVEDYDDAEALFLPHASLRPLWLGTGCVLVAAGLPLGGWLLLPGLVLIGFGLVGMVEEGRRR